MARSSSAEKVARLAEKGKGKKIRLQGGTLFPTVIVLVVVLGVALIAYARQSNQPATIAASAETTYVTSFGVYKCDGFVTGFPEIGSANTDIAALKAGATISQAGIISWKPQILAGERRAKLSTIFELFGLIVTDDSVTFPATVNGGEKITESETKCGDKNAQLEVVVWDDYSNTSSTKISIASLNGVRLTGNAMAISLAFVAKDTDVPQPDSSADLASLITKP